MKKIILSILALAMIVPAVFCLTACKKKEANIMDARAVYAMSAATSVAYLTKEDATGTGSMGAGARPELFTEQDVDAVKNGLGLFDGMVENNGVGYTLQENTTPNIDSTLDQYTFKMNIKLVGLTSSSYCTMYFNEINQSTKEEIDDGKTEIEFNTTFAGVIVFSETKFDVSGRTEVEKENGDIETEIEFIVKKSATEYIVVNQSFENNEVEYEYKLFNNGLVQDLEIEYEQTRNGVEVEIELKNITPNSRTKTTYRITKGNAEDKFNVLVRKDGKTENITITKQANGTYNFVYSNGYPENV